ncbi:MAG: Flp pilus assembly protein CpaB [Gemmatimonadaceae bacterium]|nr:Flp pilus assembly protein CpaB [Gemmatimonadaceae bacterium]
MDLNRYSVVLVVALATAGSATFGVYRLIERTRAQNQLVLAPVVIASQDIPEGAALMRSALSAERWPAASVPDSAFGQIDSVVGRVTRIAVFKGEAIIPGRLAPLGTGQGIQVKITPGKRAMAVRIDDVVGVSGLIQPDSRVDVLVTLREQGDDRQVSKLFMSNMRVLSVGTVDRAARDNEPIKATTATLEVTPFEAERLAVAMRDGTIQLVLRGYGDPDSIVTKGARTEDVLMRDPPPPPQPAPEKAGAARPRIVVRYLPAPTPAPTVAPPRDSAVIAPPKAPDSVAVQVIRGDKVTNQKFEKRDSSKSDSVKRKPPLP